MQNNILGAILFPAAISVASCSAASMGDSAPAATPVAAVEGEAVALPAGSPFAASALASFDEPWAMAFEPGTGNIFITEKPGTAKLFSPASRSVVDVTGLPEVAYGGQGGLGDVAFAPDYTSSGAIYLSWAQAAEGDARRAVVARGTLDCSGADSCAIEGLEVIWQQQPAIASRGHFSHRIAFSPDGAYLFVSSGDRMQQTPAQDMSNNLGAVVRLYPDGSVPADNPFATWDCTCEQIWSYGHRNMLGLASDLDGQLWEIEHGPAGGDELNRVDRGANYGWPDRSNGDNYNGVEIPDHAPDDGFNQPAISWNPVIAPGDMLFYSGAMFADWHGQALVANLRTTSIVRLSVDARNNSASELARYEFPERLRGIAQAPDGALWVIEDGEGGRLLRLTPAP